MSLFQFRRTYGIVGSALLSLLAIPIVMAQQPAPALGGAYSGLGERRQRLVEDWVARFIKVTGQTIDARSFYDDILNLSTKTTFDAVTHALMTTPLTDASGQKFGDGLALIERVDTVKGEVAGTSSDRQFRMYVRLAPNAREMLERSREFKRGIDNSIYHKGYPLNYRERSGSPSIQVSIALDGRRADVDVDYRASSFPVALFNGHLSAANSDVRAGNNAERHAAQWTGFQNWWRSFFGVRQERAPDAVDTTSAFVLPKIPRAGKKDIKVMVPDFLRAWLVEGDVVAAMGYVSERSYACLAQDAPDPAAFDRGLAPFQILVNLKAAREALGSHDSLEGLTTGVPLTIPGLKAVAHPHQAQFIIYDVPDNIAARFDCESRLIPGATKRPNAYGQHFGATFRIAGPGKNTSIALLWAKEDGYWKIVSWQTEPEPDKTPAAPATPELKVERIKADLSLVQAAKDFVEAWLIRKNYDAAFRYLSTKSYACYDLVRGPDAPASTSPDDAGRKIRASLERIGQWVGTSRNLGEIVEAAEPLHPAIRVMDQPYSRTFSLTSFPAALGDAVECEARARDAVPPDPLPLEYGEAFGMTLRFRTQGGDAPVLRLLWRKEDGTWRVTSYDVEVP
ncbi:MAG TPA: hypothetical protein VHI99_28730 [Vicinamibacterales bacterium]|jgi:hypothetical protein|nr:hypothetical protein [Vicinamibacterales bacterium]